MIIVRTPFRISFFGGGTDYPSWYEENGGAVLSSTINKFSYITARELPPFFDYRHRIRYFRQEEAMTLEDIEHPSVRETARYLDYPKGLEVIHNSDLPARSGLGSSSTFTVGMLHALHGLQGYMPTKRELALQAIHVEQERIGENVGSQDQIAAAFGGLNFIEFGQGGNFQVQPIIIPSERFAELESNLLLCFSGFARTASEIAATQIARTSENRDNLNRMMAVSHDAKRILTSMRAPLDEFGELLDYQWTLKRELSSEISTPEIDEIYSRGLAAGAVGGKLLGAGGGGFILFYAPKQVQEKITSSLGEKMFVPFRFDSLGSSVIYFSH